MGDEINLYDALKWMHKQKAPFRIEFITTSLIRRTGGKVKVINQALVSANQKNSYDEHMIGLKDMDNPNAPPIHTYIYSLCFINGKKITV